jgi:hypothetical protein
MCKGFVRLKYEISCKMPAKERFFIKRAVLQGVDKGFA